MTTLTASPVSADPIPDGNRKPITLNPVTSQNQVSTVILAGVPIVALTIDGRERLCLAQISTTLLKDYSYNEIHNRRVALGITCVQCTPVQLEILRRAGAMPISSRRCGMISKREAERLVRSFLEDTRPPQLPDNFCFDVVHRCGWGATGKFMPSRYNSSRAKCIKCDICNLYFSPNKFIFHYHRTPEAKYQHPDAANFNSWRRHLFLRRPESEDIVHAWEDVKAMFNGGSRKRLTPILTKNDHHSKTPNFNPEKANELGPYYPPMYHHYPFKPMTPILHRPFESAISPMKPNQFWPVPEFSPYNEALWLDQPLTPESRTDNAKSESRGDENEDSESDIDIMETEDSAEDSVERSQSPNHRSRERSNPGPNHSMEARSRSPSSPEDNGNHVARSPDHPTAGHHQVGHLQMNHVAAHHVVDEHVATDHVPANHREVNDGETEVTSSSGTKQESSKHAEQEMAENMESKNEEPPVKSPKPTVPDFESYISREEMLRLMQRESEARQQIELECHAMKENLYRELEQERKTRFALQQKLKEAHDALHSFSCKMLAARPCECTYRQIVL